ncbi:hypothetical protein TRFO_31110 [Tritrichomonas foetus]|uniref:Uncharacterized protein n=1 Tax=Tritrichomonas foetus TaxID=1144522 RepID=A0A1J4JWL4_9EUKA|nr:hypothetical protein TRFO_31110 [Tritrichomonas foetus]|eukprot:OHT01924.1 hypothetical protein TRFO_31110 [Tritrichomonas foetus]
MELSSEAPEPPSPRRICELSFKSFSEQYDKVQKLKVTDEEAVEEKNSRLFWLATTRDFTKLHEMQAVFQYLQFAKIRPKLNEIRKARHFEIWRKGVYYSRWWRLARNLRHKNRLENFHENADRVAYVRTKLAGKLYKEQTDQRNQGINAITDLSKNIIPLNVLAPRPDIPIRESLSPRGSIRGSPKGGLTPDISPINSPKKKSPRKRSPRRSPSPPRSPVVDNAVQLPSPEKEEVEIQTSIKPPSNLPIFVLVFLVALIAGVLSFFLISPSGAFTSKDAQKIDSLNFDDAHANLTDLNQTLNETTVDKNKSFILEGSEVTNETNSTILENSDGEGEFESESEEDDGENVEENEQDDDQPKEQDEEAAAGEANDVQQ